MLKRIKYEVVSTLSRVQLGNESQAALMSAPPVTHMSFQHAEISSLPGASPVGNELETSVAEPETAKVQTVLREEPKVGRNDPCPCGSGKKYKYCHGQLK
jgi:preprotein translocase subunit SecA